MRTFETGATRGSDEDKLDYEGFLSPLALKRFAQYMHKHRKQGDGSLRASDNWQKGIPAQEYMKSLLRHVMDLWLWNRGQGGAARESLEDALCAVIFNAQGYLHERLVVPVIVDTTQESCSTCEKSCKDDPTCCSRTEQAIRAWEARIENGKEKRCAGFTVTAVS